MLLLKCKKKKKCNFFANGGSSTFFSFWKIVDFFSFLFSPQVATRQCEIEFPYDRRNLMGCQRDLPHPGHGNRECKRFYEKMGAEFERYPLVDEFKIYTNDKSLNKIATCYKPQDAR